MLKSSEELIRDGLAHDEGEAQLARVAFSLRERGAEAVVITRADTTSLVPAADGCWEVVGPRVDAFDSRGGDSLTAAVAATLAGGDCATASGSAPQQRP